MSKYKNKKCEHTFQGETYKFDSTLERTHAIELFEQLKAGTISSLKLQPEFQLCEPTTLLTNSTRNGKTRRRAVIYIADFSYIKNSTRIVADSKGMKTDVYALKKNLFLSQLKKHKVDEFHEMYKTERITYKDLI